MAPMSRHFFSGPDLWKLTALEEEEEEEENRARDRACLSLEDTPWTFLMGYYSFSVRTVSPLFLEEERYITLW